MVWYSGNYENIDLGIRRAEKTSFKISLSHKDPMNTIPGSKYGIVVVLVVFLRVCMLACLLVGRWVSGWVENWWLHIMNQEPGAMSCKSRMQMKKRLEGFKLKRERERERETKKIRQTTKKRRGTGNGFNWPFLLLIDASGGKKKRRRRRRRSSSSNRRKNRNLSAH